MGMQVAAWASQPAITSVTFSGTSGPGEASPTVTVTGTGFGAAPSGTSDAVTSCGNYGSANGDVYGTKLYFSDDGNFEAGYSDRSGGNCIGIVIDSWSSKRIVLHFGVAYGSYARWYMENGDGYAISVKTTLWGGSVSGLS
jgi:hypothetical protein